MAETVVLKVAMSCQGCAGAVQRALTKMEGVDSFNVDLKEQKVTVLGNIKPEDVFQTVSKTGKKTTFWEAESEAKTKTGVAATETKMEAPATETKMEAPPTETKNEAPPAGPETKTTAASAPTSANTEETIVVAATADSASTAASS